MFTFLLTVNLYSAKKCYSRKFNMECCTLPVNICLSKVNNRNTYFTPLSSVSIVDFGKMLAGLTLSAGNNFSCAHNHVNQVPKVSDV